MIAEFDPWTATEAQAREDSQQRLGPGAAAVECLLDDQGSYCKWRAAQEVLELRSDIEAGHGRIVLYAVALCARHGLAMPEWLAGEFVRRFDLGAQLERDSWSHPDVFGSVFPRGVTRHQAEKTRRKQRVFLYRLIMEFDRRNPDAAIQRLWDMLDKPDATAEQCNVNDPDGTLRAMTRESPFRSTKAAELLKQLEQVIGGDPRDMGLLEGVKRMSSGPRALTQKRG